MLPAVTIVWMTVFSWRVKGMPSPRVNPNLVALAVNACKKVLYVSVRNIPGGILNICAQNLFPALRGNCQGVEPYMRHYAIWGKQAMPNPQ